MDWMQALIATAITAVTAFLVPILRKLGQLISAKIKQSETPVDDYLAGLAVKWAEDKLGDGKGSQKLNEAITKLIELSQGKIERTQAEALVRSSYQALYGELSQLKN